jgi:hypothetical protein
MPRELESLDGSSWPEFIASPRAVLVLGKTDCEKCAKWSAELVEFLASDEEFADVRFGKMMLDQRGLIDFKKANPWLAEVDVLPFNILYTNGEKQKAFAGGGIDRLLNRLRKL